MVVCQAASVEAGDGAQALVTHLTLVVTLAGVVVFGLDLGVDARADASHGVGDGLARPDQFVVETSRVLELLSMSASSAGRMARATVS
jgi:hypothetical protein